jgi:uncharacterized membrane protein
MHDGELALRGGIVALCLVGLYVSYFMLRKYVRGRRGELNGQSVVLSPRAVLGGVPNSLTGLIYYSLMLALTPFLSSAHPFASYAALVGAIVAALASVYLGYSLLFVTRLSCVNCWIGHVVNWSLLALLIITVRLYLR